MPIPQPSAAWKPGSNWVPSEDGRKLVNIHTGRTSAIFKRVSPKDMVSRLPDITPDVHFFRGPSGNKLNAFIAYTHNDERHIRYHETDIITLHADGSVTIRFNGWHTQSTRERMNMGFSYLGLPLSVGANGKGKAVLVRPGQNYLRIADISDTYTINADTIRTIKGE